MTSANPGTERRVRVRITGRVQGVFFRESTRREADRLGVRGWVRNQDDGSVEALVQGGAGAVEALLRWCHQGPPSAQVDNVAVADEPPADDLHGFRVTR